LRYGARQNAEAAPCWPLKRRDGVGETLRGMRCGIRIHARRVWIDNPYRFLIEWDILRGDRIDPMNHKPTLERSNLMVMTGWDRSPSGLALAAAF